MQRQERDGKYYLDSRPMLCPLCASDDFERRRGVMETRAMSFFGYDWANRGKTQLICRGCGYILSFADP